MPVPTRITLDGLPAETDNLSVNEFSVSVGASAGDTIGTLNPKKGTSWRLAAKAGGFESPDRFGVFSVDDNGVIKAGSTLPPRLTSDNAALGMYWDFLVTHHESKQNYAIVHQTYVRVNLVG
jgi:hypothetical protein